MTQTTKMPTMKFGVGARQPQQAAEPEAVPPSRQPKPTDDELASELAARFDGNYRYFRQTWYRYENGYWQVQKNINRSLKAFMIEKKWCGITPTRNKAASIDWFLQADLELDDESLIDNAPQYINMQNGLFNLETFELEPHRRDVYLTSQLSFPYDEDADCPTFREFTYTAFVDERGRHDASLYWLFLEALGYTLTADTSLKVSFWLVGESDSGKSKVIQMIRDLMGTMHATIDLNQLATNRFLLAQIAGKRAVTFTEANVNSVLADGIYKAIVGGEDEIQADVKNKEPFSFIPQAKVWWAMNEMPRVLDRSDAVYGRVIIFPMRYVPPPEKRNRHLARQLYAERSGIFNLALVGLKRLRHAGQFSHAEQVEKLREEYRRENDTEAAYAEERIERGDGYSIQSNALYQDYRAWCEDNGFKPKNKNQVAKEWQRLGFTQIHRKDGNYWTGLKLKIF